MRRFNPHLPVDPDGQHWVERFRDRAGNGQSFGYEAECILPNNVRDLWSTLQQIEYFADWFSGWVYQRPNEDLPEEFCPGQPMWNGRATLIDCSETNGMIFRQSGAFFVLTLQDYGPAATIARLRCFDYHEQPRGWLARIFGREDPNKDQSGDIRNTRARLVRLGHLTDDLKSYGQPITSEPINGRTLNWLEWNTSDGILHVLPTEDGRRIFEIGQSVRSGKIAYVVPHHLRESAKDERHYIENWYIPARADSKIVRIAKNHGDSIVDGDRIVLLES